MFSTTVTKSSNLFAQWRGAFLLGLVVALPLLSYPLSWLLPGQTQFRFMMTVPLAAIALVVAAAPALAA